MANWKSFLTLTFASIQGCYTRMLAEQFSANHIILNQSTSKQTTSETTRDTYRPLKILDRISPIGNAYLKVVLACKLYLLAKYMLIHLIWILSYQRKDYLKLDCFIWGRFRHFGRTNKIASSLAFWALAVLLSHKLVCLSSYSNSFRFHFIEFLFHNQDQVIEIELVQLEQAKRRSSTRKLANVRHRAISAELIRSRSAELAHKFRYNPLFHIRNDFVKPGHPDEFLLRPNRTSCNWTKLDTLTQAMFWFASLTLFGWFTLMVIAASGGILTNLGFELGYSSCVAWLRQVQTSDNSSEPTDWTIQYIYRAPEVLAHELPLERLPIFIPLKRELLLPLTSYHVARIMMDMFDCCFIYFEFICSYLVNAYFVTMISMDTLLNGRQIWAQMRELTMRLENGPYQDQFHIIRTRIRESNSQQHLALLPEEQQLTDELTRSQAILADHFQLMDSYNKYISYILLEPIAWWMSYNIFICTWMGQMRSRVVENEFMLVETASVLAVLSILCVAAVTRSQNKRIYLLITKLMALDRFNAPTKPRWVKLLKHYHPKPMFCFTLLNSIEVSWFFCLKLASWIMTIFVVLASFYLNRT